MKATTSPDPKPDALRRQGTLNSRPQAVKAALFGEHEFFDPRDLLQVKYEMLRQAEQVKASVTQTAAAFGFSRVAFYQIRSQFEQNGLAGLLPRPRGPRSAHKLTGEIMQHLEQTLVKNPTLRMPTLVEMVQAQFGISVHRRSVERALVRRQKKRRS